MAKTKSKYDIGGAVKSVIQEIGMNQIELAEKCGIDSSYMSLIINNRKTPTLATLDKICEGAGTDVLTLMFKAVAECGMKSNQQRRLTREIHPKLKQCISEIYGKD